MTAGRSDGLRAFGVRPDPIFKMFNLLATRRSAKARQHIDITKYSVDAAAALVGRGNDPGQVPVGGGPPFVTVELDVDGVALGTPLDSHARHRPLLPPVPDSLLIVAGGFLPFGDAGMLTPAAARRLPAAATAPSRRIDAVNGHHLAP